MPRTLGFAVLAAVALTAGACHLPRLSRLFAGDVEMKVAISPQLNHNAPVAVEVIFANDQKVLDQLLAMDAKTWFARRDQFLKDHAGQHAFDSWKWEWVPGQGVDPIPLSYRIGARGGVIFASYTTTGAHRQRIDAHRDIQLDLGDTDLTVKQDR